MSISLKTRCNNCQKKTMYFSECKCQNTYCFNCLSFDKHKCTFNWKLDKKEYLNQQNPQITAQKVEFI